MRSKTRPVAIPVREPLLRLLRLLRHGANALRAALVLVALLVSACCSEPWRKHPEPTRPDEQYSIGGSVHGYDVYVWHCLRDARVVVYQYSAEWTCQSAVRETAPCDGTTAFEQTHATERRDPVRQLREWR